MASLASYLITMQRYCPMSLAREAQCPLEFPQCCSINRSVVCCTTSCDVCSPNHPNEANVLGSEMSVNLLSVIAVLLCVLLIFGSLGSSALGRHGAWLLERWHISSDLRRRARLRKEEQDAYRQELEASSNKNVPEEVACLICCSRMMDCAIMPCGHVCACGLCARRLRECPVCRAALEEFFELPEYLVLQLSRKNTNLADGDVEDVEAVLREGWTALDSDHHHNTNNNTNSNNSDDANMPVSCSVEDVEDGDIVVGHHAADQ